LVKATKAVREYITVAHGASLTILMLTMHL
jgi:hypothetical protein